MASGKVVHFDAVKGFGFVAPDGGGNDVFLHVNDIDGDESQLRPGTAITFDVEGTDRGPKAVNVTFAGGGSPAGDSGNGRLGGERKRDFAPSRAAHSTDSPRRESAPVSDRRDRGGRDGSRDNASNAVITEITELLLAAAPDLTAAQIVAIRGRLATYVDGHGR